MNSIIWTPNSNFNISLIIFLLSETSIFNPYKLIKPTINWIIKEKYADKVEIITIRSVPYSVYITSYDKAHIVLDQVYAIDQGYNALEAMAKGKVVFTGAEKPFESYYKLQEKVAINAQPDVAYLVDQLSLLIENPSEIIAIGTRARAFVEQEHDSIKVAQKYCDTWK